MRKSVYGVHPAVNMTQKTLASLKDKTGRSLEDWIAVVRQSGPMTQKERARWLREEQGIAAPSAQWIAERAEGKSGDTDSPELYLAAAERYVEEMFSGRKAALRPLYDELLSLGLSQGKDVKACPCTTMVPLYRNHVFAQIKPATNTRIDLGFALGARQAEGRLIDTGGYAKRDRITHRIPIESAAGIDAEVKQWLKTAYEEDAG